MRNDIKVKSLDSDMAEKAIEQRMAPDFYLRFWSWSSDYCPPSRTVWNEQFFERIQLPPRGLNPAMIGVLPSPGRVSRKCWEAPTKSSSAIAGTIPP